MRCMWTTLIFNVALNSHWIEVMALGMTFFIFIWSHCRLDRSFMKRLGCTRYSPPAINGHAMDCQKRGFEPRHSHLWMMGWCGLWVKCNRLEFAKFATLRKTNFVGWASDVLAHADSGAQIAWANMKQKHLPTLPTWANPITHIIIKPTKVWSFFMAMSTPIIIFCSFWRLQHTLLMLDVQPSLWLNQVTIATNIFY